MGSAAVEVSTVHRSAQDIAENDLTRAFASAELDDVTFISNYSLPSSSVEVDLVLTGTASESGRSTVVVVELKQWRRQGPPADAQVQAARQQVSQSLMYLQRSLQLDEDFDLLGAVLIEGAPRKYTESRSPVHVATRAEDLVAGLRPHLDGAGGARVAQRFLASPVMTNPLLAQVAAAEVRSGGQFVLLDRQQAVVDTVWQAVGRSRERNSKEVVIVTGGPGSGKTAVTLSILGEATRLGLVAQYASGSRTLTQGLRRTAGSRSPRIQALFKYFNNFADAAENSVDLLLCDDAQQIRATSTNRYTAARLRTGRSQIDELIDAARVAVFLIDEFQLSGPGEVGSVSLIQSAAHARDADVHRIDLSANFRAGGSGSYLPWIEQLLLGEIPPATWEREPNFDLKVVPSPDVMELELASKMDQGATARMTAGLCWPWTEPTEGDLTDDVVIGDWHRPWATKGDRRVGSAPPLGYWATQDSGFGQLGNVYTTQGLEFEWVGVIMGPDLVRRNGGWVADRTASFDMARARRASDVEFDRMTRQAYRLLLTRGLRGTLLYSTDGETQAFLENLVNDNIETTSPTARET